MINSRLQALTFGIKHEREMRSEEEMILELREKLYESVSLRVQGDVPVGVYLSGGLDSAVIAGILADVLKARRENDPSNRFQKSLSCFSVGFEEGTEFDEMRKSYTLALQGYSD